ncbi:MAG: two-component sensor histidine kinase [Gammaproteobacteria bacterium TMED119]|jgi:two-component system phosphate regulon sensor histidine kinase PhoR|nr:MAG: two-component sensor histidine kinase [Gammaproteobacteria bacterium TMED119]PDH45945.1 MAG: two-component sensor histidine kinase [Flavobacteriales bacterium MED-G15]|tara:strand:+ start:574 stop:1572 length:999 start_codon:yes stop_codon:yes gene_type:complete
MFILALMLFMFFYLTGISLASEEILMILIVFVLFFISSVLLINYRVERFILNKVKGIYNDLLPSGVAQNKMVIQSDMEALKKSLQKLADDKKLEIESLKEKENYRKEFIGNISHELKTPLFTIQGYVLTLLQGAVKDKVVREKYLKRTAKGVERLIYIVKDLDLITQFESGIKSIDRTYFDIIKLVQNVFDLLEMQASKNNITIGFDREYHLPVMVYADEERIQQVLTNLIINSLKYGVEKGKTEVTIQEVNDEKIVVRINDNGEGIAEEHIPRLFERFYRVDKSGNRKQGGSGLGLAIVKHIIEAHQEKLLVESTPGVGSEFSFTLQRASD